jgi:hypothetical protein
MTQDSAYLAATVNPNLVVPTLPATSLHGDVATLDASFRLSAELSERLRVNASLTAQRSRQPHAGGRLPSVSTDMFLGADPRSNLPYSFTQDRLKLGADYRGPGSWKLAAGTEYDSVKRTLQETGTTREATLWTRASAKPLDKLSLSLKLTQPSARRRTTTRSRPSSRRKPAAAQIQPGRSAARQRLAAGRPEPDRSGQPRCRRRHGQRDYRHSAVGLTRSRSADVSADLVGRGLGEHPAACLRAGRIYPLAAVGQPAGGAADWSGRVRDGVQMFGLGVTHNALKGKLELSGNVAMSRSRSAVAVDAGASNAAFPTATHSLDSVTLNATYKLNDNSR